MKLVAALQSDQMEKFKKNTIGTWQSVTGVAIEFIVLGRLFFSEKPSAIFFHENPSHQ